MAIHIHVINTTGLLDKWLDKIFPAFETAQKSARELLDLDSVDVIVRHNPSYALDELGVGGFSDSLNRTVYISVGDLKENALYALESCMHHELYHIKRHQLMGIPKELKERVVDEGLACAYEQHTTGEPPIYASQEIENKYIGMFLNQDNITKGVDEWFFGSRIIPKWLGYSLGLTIIKIYATKKHASLSELLHTKTSTIYKETRPYLPLEG